MERTRKEPGRPGFLEPQFSDGEVESLISALRAASTGETLGHLVRNHLGKCQLQTLSLRREAICLPFLGCLQLLLFLLRGLGVVWSRLMPTCSLLESQLGQSARMPPWRPCWENVGLSLLAGVLRACHQERGVQCITHGPGAGGDPGFLGSQISLHDSELALKPDSFPSVHLSMP